MSIFRKPLEKIHVCLKSEKNNEYFTQRRIYNYDYISLNSSQNKKYFRKSCRENQNIHFMFNNVSSESRAVYGIMWKNMAEPDR
jgi:hypothetical protein